VMTDTQRIADDVARLFELRREQVRYLEEGGPREAAEWIDRIATEVKEILAGAQFLTIPHVECEGTGCDACGYLGYVRDTDPQ
jgi:plasmid stabilization system protein ParE